MIYNIYTDGSAIGKTPFYIGGWAVIVFKGSSLEDNVTEVISGNEYLMTNNKAELTALYEAIKFAKRIKKEEPESHINIYSDSQYSLNSILIWCKKWRKNGWLNSKKEPVANKELIEKIMNELILTTDYINFIKVKGHSDDFGNCLADSEATRQSEILRSEMTKAER